MFSFDKHLQKDFDFIVATDGACKGNPGPGTWAFVVFNPLNSEILGHKKSHKATTTNNEMELTAIIQAMSWAQKHSKSIHIKTDSAYCLNGINSWLDGWANKGWKSSSGKPIANLALWKELYSLKNKVTFKLEKVKGHSGDRYNDAADMYCNEEYLNKFM